MFRHGARYTRFFAALCFLLAVASSSAQTTIHVPADQPSIQAGTQWRHRLGQSGNLPTMKTSILRKKSIIVTSGATSAAGAVATFINGFVSFHSGEPRTAILDGFTFQNLTGTIVDISLSSPTVTNNAFLKDKGCAIAIANSSANQRILANHISGLTLGPSGLSGSGFIPTGTAIGARLGGDIEIAGNTI